MLNMILSPNYFEGCGILPFLRFKCGELSPQYGAMTPHNGVIVHNVEEWLHIMEEWLHIVEERLHIVEEWLPIMDNDLASTAFSLRTRTLSKLVVLYILDFTVCYTVS